MGRRGPPPVPNAVKLAMGETRPSRVNYAAPVPRNVPPTAPGDMSRAAKVVWTHVLREMPPGVIVAVDRYALRMYCEAVVRYTEAQLLYQKSTPLVRIRGSLVKNPLHQVIRDCAEQARLWARELGLTPAARAGLRLDMDDRMGDIEATIGLPPRLRVVNDGP